MSEPIYVELEEAFTYLNNALLATRASAIHSLRMHYGKDDEEPADDVLLELVRHHHGSDKETVEGRWHFSNPYHAVAGIKGISRVIEIVVLSIAARMEDALMGSAASVFRFEEARRRDGG